MNSAPDLERIHLTTTIGHRGPCGKRVLCWDPICRAKFGDYKTVEVLANLVIARCHNLAHPLDDPRLRGAA